MGFAFRFRVELRRPPGKVGFPIEQGGFQPCDGTLLPGPQMGDHIFDGQVGRQFRGYDSLLAQAGQEVGDPEGMDDVLGGDLEAHGLADRQV